MNVKTYAEFSLLRVGTVQLGLTFTLACIALYHTSIPFEIDETNFNNRTMHILNNYQVFPNGSLFFEYVWPSGTVEVGLVKQEWINERKSGRLSYYFGENGFNYCRERKIPATDRFPSLFKSSQLKAAVQVPLRAIVLLTMTTKIFQILSITENGTKKDSVVMSSLGYVLICNEIVYNVSQFILTNHLYTPDKDLMAWPIIAVLVLHLTFIIKMCLTTIFSKPLPANFLRICMMLIAGACYTVNSELVKSTLRDQVCDEYTTLLFFIAEYTMLVLMAVALLLDISETMYLDLLVYLTPEDERKYPHLGHA